MQHHRLLSCFEIACDNCGLTNMRGKPRRAGVPSSRVQSKRHRIRAATTPSLAHRGDVPALCAGLSTASTTVLHLPARAVLSFFPHSPPPRMEAI